MATAWHLAGKMMASVNVEGVAEEGIQDGLRRKHPALRQALRWLRYVK